MPPSEVIAAARAAQAKYKVPASVSIAQWALESGWGHHSPGCNPFGIKHMAGYPDQHFLTHEVVHGAQIECEQTFAVFSTLTQAFEAHAALIATRPVYAAAMAVLPDLVKFLTLMGHHYATDPAYAAKLTSIIHGANLTQYDVS
jgi:flagellum-specific peptidoglycan hydrolase FlgJ